jgi:signal transduction histidine kinase
VASRNTRRGDLDVPPWGHPPYHPRATSPGRVRFYTASVTRRRLIDAGLAGAALGLSLAMLAGGGFGSAGADVRPLDGLGVVLAAASALPLAVQWSAPLAVYLVTAAASVALDGLGYPFDLPFGPVIAAYAVGFAHGGDERPWRRLVALLATMALVPATAGAYLIRGVDLAEIAPEMLFWSVVMAGVWLAGDRSRLRREQVEAAEQRASRTEREAERERRLAVAEEQTRIARELHDSAGHAINVILVQAGAARLLRDRDPEAVQRAISTIEDVARTTVTEIDMLVRALRDGGRGDAAMPADPGALEELLDRHRAGGLAVGADLRGPRGPLPRGVAWAAYRILQEALSNAARHGRGTAQVTVDFEPRAVEITVTNPTTGTGIAGERGGHGIIGMRERAKLLGGSFEAACEHGVFRVRARLPHAEVGS